MRLRVSTRLHERLLWASGSYNMAISEMFRRSLRRFRRLRDEGEPECDEVLHPSVVQSILRDVTTSKEQVLSLDIPEDLVEGFIASDLRKIVVWYMDDAAKKDRTPRFYTTAIKNKDYTIKKVV